MKTLPDPRRYDSSHALHGSRLIALLAEFPAPQQGIEQALEAEIVRLLAEDGESDLRAAAAGALSSAHCRRLLEALERVMALPAPASVQVRVFAIPVLLVAGGETGSRLPGVLPDPAGLTRLFETAGALGRSRNFGLSSALASLAALEAVPWRTLYRIVLESAGPEIARLDLPPADVLLRSGGEQVDLRFITGAAVAPADTASFLESGGDIGRWGLKFTGLLSRQLSGNGATVLAIPRPPMSVIRAAQAGRFACAELGFQLFVGSALRRARMRFGDPDVSVAAHPDATIRVRLTSSLDDDFVEEYRWPLAPADDLAEVARSIFGLLAEVRLDRVTVLDTVIGTDQEE